MWWRVLRFPSADTVALLTLLCFRADDRRGTCGLRHEQSTLAVRDILAALYECLRRVGLDLQISVGGDTSLQYPAWQIGTSWDSARAPPELPIVVEEFGSREVRGSLGRGAKKNMDSLRLVRFETKPLDFLIALAILVASATLWSRTCCHFSEHIDVSCSPSHLGFRKADYCAELVATSCLALDKRMEWRMTIAMAHVDFARAGNFDAQAGCALAFARGAPTRGAPSLHDFRSWTVAHGRYSSGRGGLRRGCSAAPLLFRWVLQDCMEVSHTRWEASGLGIDFFSKVLTRLARADDAWLFSASCQSLDRPMRELLVAAEAEVGLDIRWDKRSVALVAPPQWISCRERIASSASSYDSGHGGNMSSPFGGTVASGSQIFWRARRAPAKVLGCVPHAE